MLSLKTLACGVPAIGLHNFFATSECLAQDCHSVIDESMTACYHYEYMPVLED